MQTLVFNVLAGGDTLPQLHSISYSFDNFWFCFVMDVLYHSDSVEKLSVLDSIYTLQVHIRLILIFTDHTLSC